MGIDTDWHPFTDEEIDRSTVLNGVYMAYMKVTQQFITVKGKE